MPHFRSHARLLLAASLLPILVLAGLIQSAAQSLPPEDPTGPEVAPHPGLGRVEPALLKQVLEASPGQSFRVIVELQNQADLSAWQAQSAGPEQVVGALQAEAARSQASLLSFLDAESTAGRVTDVHPFWVLNGVGLTGGAETLLALAARPEVALIREDRWRQWVDPILVPRASTDESPALPWNVSQVGADRVWNSFEIDGGGVTVAIMDTGVDWQHPALQAQYRGYKPGGLTVHQGNWFCTTSEAAAYPVDGYGHGTHVAGTVLGRAVGGQPAIGVAPGAQWIAVKTLNDAGWGYDSWIHAAFEWLLAPAGNPALAPDVVNGSWGKANGESDVFRADLQALRAAGIVPVFAAGNGGPEPETMGSPASYPEAIAVGASNDLDQVLDFSSRGPSFWGEVKPEVVAPGLDILSSLPGGTYATSYGTSMAAPHVSGLAALLLQADGGLSVDEVEALIAGTALPLGPELPNNDSGRGRIDAYQAVATALQAGSIRGEVRTTAAGSSPIAGAQISVYDEQNQRRAVVQTDEAGLYSVALPAGVYRLLVEAFAFAPQSQPDVALAFSETVSVDFFLDPLPLGTLEGEVRDAETNEPLSVQLLVQGTPVSTRSSAESGHYRLDLPAGLYALEARQNGYRRLVAEDLEVQAGQSTSHTLVLSPAPTLLLVDSGWWYYDSHGQTLAQALEDSDYVHDLWQVRTPTDAPALEDLLAYDAVVWSSPLDSPELIGAGDTISYYLGLGGNLLLTGQDVGFWESGRSGFVWHEYYGKLLQAELVSDDAGRGDLIGTPDSILSGLALPVNGPDSDRNQVTPDSIQARDSRIAHLIGQYVSDGGGALQAEGCQSYRAVYLAAGLEGLGDRASRATVIERALDWLGRPHLATGVDLYPDHQEHVWEDGPDLTYRVGLRNLGQAADRFTLELSPSAWDTSLWDSTFETQIAESPVLAPCEWFTVGLKIQVPGDIPWNAGDVVTLTARSVSDPGHTAQATFSSKTPAPILLVDDQRWYDNSGRYRAALEANGLPYDLWSTRRPLAPDLAPSAQRLARYPLVVWFTGFDWYKTLTPEEEARLATYLDEGGRLLLSSQDYLYTSGFTPFARDYFGLAGYTENLSVTQFVGAGSSLLGQQVDPVALSYPFRNWSDALRPNPEGRIVAWGQHGQPVGLTLEHAPWKTAFFSFPLETMPQPELERLMAETVAWLSPLGDSVFTVDRATARPGEQLTYTLEIRNTGPRPLAGVSLSNTVPSGASYLDGSLQGPASYDPAERRIHWLGPLAAGQGLTVSYRVQLDAPLPAGGEISNVMDLGDESGLSLQRTALSRIGTPDLSASSKTVSAEKAFVGQVLIYTITLRNDGLEPAPAELVDPWPPYTLPLLGSAWASGGQITATDQALLWRGTIPVGDDLTLHFVTEPLATAAGLYAYNRATVDDGWGRTYPLEAPSWIEVRFYLPLIFR